MSEEQVPQELLTLESLIAKVRRGELRLSAVASWVDDIEVTKPGDEYRSFVPGDIHWRCTFTENA